MANIATFVLAATLLTVSTTVAPTPALAAETSAVNVAAPAPAATPTATQLTIPIFSNQPVGAVPKAWSFQTIRTAPNATTYALVRDEELASTVLQGTAAAAAGALVFRFDADAAVHPILRFKWKPNNLIASSDPHTKTGDDYVARIYVTFATDPKRAGVKEKAENAIAHVLYNETPPHAALSYVFTHKAAPGAIIVSPYTQRVKKIVVDADPASIGRWKSFERDIYADYKRAFGEEPTRISGIAIMVDTDNTGETASARFGDITLTSRP